MSLLTIITALVAISSLVIGTLIFLRNPRGSVNRWFFITCFLAAAWSVAFEATEILFAANPDPTMLWALRLTNRASYALGLLLTYSIVIFTFYFPVKKKQGKILQISSLLMLITVIFSFTPSIAGLATIDNETNKYVISTGDYSLVYIFVMLLGVVLLVKNLGTRHKYTDQIQRIQTRLLIVGFGLSLVIGLFLSVVSLILFPDSGIDAWSPFAVIIFLIAVGSAVARYRLFDFRLIVARTLAYGSTLIVVGLLYLLPAVYILSKLLGVDIPPSSLFLLVPIGLFIIIGYGYLRRFLDKITGKIFFRNEYVPEEFIGELNRSVVSNLDLDSMLRNAAQIMASNLKAEHVTFIFKDESNGHHMVGTQAIRIDNKDLHILTELLHRSTHRIVIADYLEPEETRLQKFLQRYEVAAVARIMDDSKDQVEMGYIFFGAKLSGQQYSTRDARTLNTIIDGLIVAIQNAMRFEEVKNFSATLQERVDAATHKLQKTNEKLKQMDETKDEFISMASHQLRTPLTSVKGYLSMVIEGDAGPLNEMQHKLLNQAFTSSQRMVFLIADLLNVSRLRTGKFVIEPKPTNLADLVQGEVEQLHETAEGRGLKLSYKKPAKFPELMMDDTKIRQVVMNFMDNAIYYTPSGGHITVELKDHKDTIEYTVTDDGMGVPKHEQHHLFNKFYRAGNARKARPDGTGLGLFMAKKVVVAQGGSILFKSQEGKGSTFGFTFAKSHLSALKPTQPAQTPNLTPTESTAAVE